jgi:hypothetical protein
VRQPCAPIPKPARRGWPMTARQRLFDRSVVIPQHGNLECAVSLFIRCSHPAVAIMCTSRPALTINPACTLQSQFVLTAAVPTVSGPAGGPRGVRRWGHFRTHALQQSSCYSIALSAGSESGLATNSASLVIAARPSPGGPTRLLGRIWVSLAGPERGGLPRSALFEVW